MSNTLSAHEPINYLDSILNEEEKRCEYSHQWRNFTISRSGRYKSKNRKRDVVDGKFFDARSDMLNNGGSNASGNSSNALGGSNSSISNYGGSGNYKEQNKNTTYQFSSQTSNSRGMHDKKETYKSCFETNL